MGVMESVSIVSGVDPERYAWSRLERFRNVTFTTELICEIHKVPSAQRKNAAKQAQQIRHCLTQGREYFEAARAVSLATSPLLYYYGAMYFALAEILFKQDGRSSLGKARAENRHHGLSFHGGDNVDVHDSLAISAGKLRAAPHITPQGRRGTFSLWHRSAREYPFCGSVRQIYEGYGTTTFSMAGTANDVQLKQIPDTGISLLQCIRHIEDMRYLCHSHGISSLLVPARVNVVVDYPAGMIRHSVILDVADPDAVSRVYESIKVDAKDVDRIDVIKTNGGYIINSNWPINDHQKTSYPSTVQSKKDGMWMFADNVSLNEFGLYYVSLFIAGNYARYFPDRWMADVESSSAISAAMGDLVGIVDRRVPTLMVSELERSLVIYS